MVDVGATEIEFSAAGESVCGEVSVGAADAEHRHHVYDVEPFALEVVFLHVNVWVNVG